MLVTLSTPQAFIIWKALVLTVCTLFNHFDFDKILIGETIGTFAQRSALYLCLKATIHPNHHFYCYFGNPIYQDNPNVFWEKILSLTVDSIDTMRLVWNSKVYNPKENIIVFIEALRSAGEYLKVPENMICDQIYDKLRKYEQFNTTLSAYCKDRAAYNVQSLESSLIHDYNFYLSAPKATVKAVSSKHCTYCGKNNHDVTNCFAKNKLNKFAGGKIKKGSSASDICEYVHNGVICGGPHKTANCFSKPGAKIPMCSNEKCKKQRGHTIENCWAPGGGKHKKKVKPTTNNNVQA